MKTFKIVFVALSAMIISVSASAQDKPKKVETAEFKVSGSCGMCEKRIENAALIKGVKFADWNKETQILKVIYKTKHASAEDVKKAVAGVGHDTDSVKAEDDVYKELPNCCSYRDGIEVH